LAWLKPPSVIGKGSLPAAAKKKPPGGWGGNGPRRGRGGRPEMGGVGGFLLSRKTPGRTSCPICRWGIFRGIVRSAGQRRRAANPRRRGRFIAAGTGVDLSGLEETHGPGPGRKKMGPSNGTKPNAVPLRAFLEKKAPGTLPFCGDRPGGGHPMHWAEGARPSLLCSRSTAPRSAGVSLKISHLP